MLPPYLSSDLVRDILSRSSGQGSFFFANENLHPMKQPTTTLIFNDIRWKCNAFRHAIRENNFHIKPVRLREHGEQNHSFPEALISMNAIGNFADPFFICFYVHAALRMPASQCHFEGKDKTFPRVQLFTPWSLCPATCGRFPQRTFLAPVVGRQRQAPAHVLRHPQSVSSRTRGERPPGPPICHLHLGCAVLRAKKTRTQIGQNSWRPLEFLLSPVQSRSFTSIGPSSWGNCTFSSCRRHCES